MQIRTWLFSPLSTELKALIHQKHKLNPTYIYFIYLFFILLISAKFGCSNLMWLSCTWNGRALQIC